MRKKKHPQIRSNTNRHSFRLTIPTFPNPTLVWEYEKKTGRLKKLIKPKGLLKVVGIFTTILVLLRKTDQTVPVSKTVTSL